MLALALNGCGSKGTATPATQPSAAAGATSAPAATASSGASGQAPEATDVAPVDVKLVNGGFAPSTPHTFHLPSGFLVLVHVKTGSGGPYSLSVLSPSTAQTFKIASNDTQNISLDALKKGETAKLMLGGQTVKIAADAQPGP